MSLDHMGRSGSPNSTEPRVCEGGLAGPVLFFAHGCAVWVLHVMRDQVKHRLMFP